MSKESAVVKAATEGFELMSQARAAFKKLVQDKFQEGIHWVLMERKDKSRKTFTIPIITATGVEYSLRALGIYPELEKEEVLLARATDSSIIAVNVVRYKAQYGGRVFYGIGSSDARIIGTDLQYKFALDGRDYSTVSQHTAFSKADTRAKKALLGAILGVSSGGVDKMMRYYLKSEGKQAPTVNPQEATQNPEIDLDEDNGSELPF